MEDTTEARITLRLPTVLRDRLLKAAEQTNRSMNGEIVFRLDDFDRLNDDLINTLERLGKLEERAYTALSRLRHLEPEHEALLLAAAEQEKRIEELLRQRDELNQQVGEAKGKLEAFERTDKILASVFQMLDKAAEGDESSLQAMIGLYRRVNKLDEPAATTSPEQTSAKPKKGRQIDLK